jgi:ribose transport system ATP-binding protein
LADGALTDINFTLRRGEIVGIAGITGSGRETLLRSIFDSTTRSGAVEVGGGQLPAGRPDLAVKHGLAFLPADRRRLASFQGLDATANLSIGDLGRFKRRGRISRRAERTEARKWFQLFDVRPKGAIGARLSSFSGGNQQKILLAKWFRLRPDALLLDEPTQGVDIGAKAEIHTQIRAAADDGAGVLVASSDVDELFALCSRVIVLRNGHLVIDQPTTVLTAAEIGHECLGADSTGSNNDRIN